MMETLAEPNFFNSSINLEVNSTTGGLELDFGETNLTNNETYSEKDTPYPDYSQITIVRASFVCLFIIEFVIGVIGNVLVCATVYRNKSMHSPVNYYIVNLGLCDSVICFFILPTKLFQLTAEANVNMMTDFWCTLIRFFESVVVFVSVFTLVAICIERYYAVVYPMQCFQSNAMTDYRIRRVLFIVWMIPIIVASPNLYPAEARTHYLFSEHGEFTRLTCFDTFTDTFRKWYFLFLFVFMYVIPLIFIGATCFSITRALMRKIPIQPRMNPRALTLEHGRRKVAKMVLVIVCTFVVCWSPYFLVTIVTQLQTVNFLHQGQFFFTMLSINLLCFTNSCVNPFVYFAMSARFRKGFIGILRLLSICSRRDHPYSPDTSLTSIRRTTRRRNGLSRKLTSETTGSRSVNNKNQCCCNRSNLTNGRHIRTRSSDSNSTPVTPNKSTGNTRNEPSSSRRHGRHRHKSSSHRSRTIVFEFRHFETTPVCQAQFISLDGFDSPQHSSSNSNQESMFL